MIKNKIHVLLAAIVISVSGYSQESNAANDSVTLKISKHGNINKYFLFGDKSKADLGDFSSNTDSVSINVKDVSVGISITYEKGIKTKAVGRYSSGKIYRETTFNEFGLDGSDIIWYESGEKYFQTSYKDNINISPMISWYPSGKLMSISDYNSDKNIGKIQKWSENGTLIEETIAIDSTESGVISNFYHESGNLMTTSIFNAGKQDYLSYYEDGTLFAKGQIIDAYWSKVGTWVKYYENGNKESEIHFKETENVNEANIKTGVWKYWDKNGNLMREETYRNGELVDSKEYIPTKVRD